MPRPARSLGWAYYVVRSGVTNAIGRSHVLFGRRDPFGAIELTILALDVVALFLVATVPFARHFAGQLAIAEPEGERQRERDRAKKNRERRGHDLCGNPKLLESHERGKQNDATLAAAGERRPAVESTRRRHDQAADEAAEYNADNHDDDRGDDARDVAHQLREHIGERLESQRVGGDEHHREHHEPEDETARDTRGVHARTRSLHRLHHPAALEDRVEVDPFHEAVGSPLEQPRQEIAGKEDDQRAEQRWYVAIELLEAALHSVAEGECRRGVH